MPTQSDDDDVSSSMHLVQDLCECAGHVEAGAIERAGRCLARATGDLAAAAGDDGPLRRLAVPMADALARRLVRLMVPAVADALIDPSDHLDPRCVRAARRRFFELSPFFRAAAAVTNRAILEAMENEKNVHVIDFAGPTAQPCQWIQLLREFHRRPGGPPHLRLTIVHDDGDLLANISERLAKENEELDVPLQVHRVVSQIEALDPTDLHGVLGLKSGEARAVVCTLQLHRLLAAADDPAGTFSAGHRFNQTASVARLQQMASTSCPPSVGACRAGGGGGGYDDDDDIDSSPATPMGFVSPPLSTPQLQMPPALASFLSAAGALSPEVVVVTEQEASHGGVSFRKRFGEALGYYAAVYDSLDAAAEAYRRPAAERAEVERAVLGEEIRDVLLRDGAHRRERHDRLQRWAARMELGGFRSVPLSYAAVRQGNDVLHRCGLIGCGAAPASREHGGCLLLCWSSSPLYSVSAWRPDARSGAPGSCS
ncbi:scarecrow-like protein 3 [Sorghum bicolor]|nr:scarecrow-like protein 3 [Sorghum bicolor]|eukprot:XP_002450245.2 scarecrow-like protein 3 [Sorghum bicolor]